MEQIQATPSRPCGLSKALILNNSLYLSGWFGGEQEDVKVVIELPPLAGVITVGLTQPRPDIAEKYSLPLDRRYGFDTQIPLRGIRLPDSISYKISFQVQGATMSSKQGELVTEKILSNNAAPSGISEFCSDGKIIMVRGWCASNFDNVRAEVTISGLKPHQTMLDVLRPDIAARFDLPPDRPYGFTTFIDVAPAQRNPNFCEVAFTAHGKVISKSAIEGDTKTLDLDQLKGSNEGKEAARQADPYYNIPLLRKLRMNYSHPLAYRLIPGLKSEVERLKTEITDLECLVATLGEENLLLHEQISHLQKHRKDLGSILPKLLWGNERIEGNFIQNEMAAQHEVKAVLSRATGDSFRIQVDVRNLNGSEHTNKVLITDGAEICIEAELKESAASEGTPASDEDQLYGFELLLDELPDNPLFLVAPTGENQLAIYPVERSL